LITGRNERDKIIVPAQIDDYAAVESILNRIAPVETVTGKPFSQKYQGAFSILMVGAMICVFTVSNKIITVLSGVAVKVVMMWAFVETRKNKNIDAKTKRASWFMLVVAAAVALIVWAKLSGFKDNF
jgi:hypothetical protein